MSGIIFKGPDDFSAPISFVGMYSDGTPMVKTEDFENIVEYADKMILRPHSLNEFVVAMFLVDAISSHGGRINTLVLPFVPGARQDRVNPTGDVLFTARSVTAMINARSFSRVVILDPHSEVTPYLIRNVLIFPLEDVAAKLWKGYGGVIAPDKGAHDRAKEVADALGLDLTYGSKVRDVSTGRLSGFDVTVEAGKHYLVADDICDGGGTFVGLGEKIREQGAYADLYVTHGIFSKGTDELKKIYKNIYTTDSRQVHARNDVYVIPVVGEMENYR